jgi:hypothetical protein
VVELHNCLELEGELHNSLEEEGELHNCPVAVEEEHHNSLEAVAEELRSFLAVAEVLVEGELAVDRTTRHLEEQNEEVEPSLLVLHSKVAWAEGDHPSVLGVGRMLVVEDRVAVVRNFPAVLVVARVKDDKNCETNISREKKQIWSKALTGGP